MNVDVGQLQPGVYGVSHGSGPGGEIIRAATGSWAGHAFLYLGGGLIVQGTPPRADIVPATTYSDAIWAWRMWDQLAASRGWTPSQVASSQALVTARGHTLVGTSYDDLAYGGFAMEVLHLRTEPELAGVFEHDPWRVCSALVYDAETTGGVPMEFTPEDGPGLVAAPGTKAVMPPNLVAPGMLLGLAQRMEWV